MSPQLSQQQIGAMIQSFENRLKSKKLEVDALGRMRVAAKPVLSLLLPPRAFTNVHTSDGELVDRVPDDSLPANSTLALLLREVESFGTATEDLFTAKINWLLIDILEFELQIKMLKSQQSGIVAPGGMMINKS